MSSNPVAQRIWSVMTAAPQADAVFFEGNAYTWGDIKAGGDRLVALLAENGIDARTPVGLVIRNTPTGLAALLGLLVHDRPPVLISSIQPGASIAAAISRIGPRVVVADAVHWSPELRAATAALGAVGIALLNDEAGLGVSIRVEASDMPSTELTLLPDTAMVVSTSGTTGTPKPIELAWDDLPIDVSDTSLPRAGDARPPVIHALSLATITGVAGVLRGVGRARSMAILERIDVHQWAALVERFKPRRAGLPPAAMRTMLDDAVPVSALASLEAWVTGSAPLSPELQVEFEARYGIPVLISYGATEFGGAIAAWTLEDRRQYGSTKLGSVGRALPAVELRIVDQNDGSRRSVGEPGLLEVRKLAKADGTGGWIRTNDIGTIDKDGFLFLHGRHDDVIIRGGFKVPLGELEAVFRAHPDVLDVAAVGLPDERLGQLPAVAVVLTEGAAIDGATLREWSRTQTAPYKVPVSVRIIDAIPLTTSHKVSRTAVAALITLPAPAAGT